MCGAQRIRLPGASSLVVHVSFPLDIIEQMFYIPGISAYTGSTIVDSILARRILHDVAVSTGAISLASGDGIVTVRLAHRPDSSRYRGTPAPARLQDRCPWSAQDTRAMPGITPVSGYLS